MYLRVQQQYLILILNNLIERMGAGKHKSKIGPGLLIAEDG